MLELNKIHKMDARIGLPQLPDELIGCCVTSPPYWAVRSYGEEVLIWDGNPDCKHEWQNKGSKKIRPRPDHSGHKLFGRGEQTWTSNLGSELKFGEGCIKCDAWRGNLGLEPTPELYIKHLCDIFDQVKRVLRNDGTCWINLGDCYQDKQLCLIPHRFAIEMCNRGWLLRSTIIWAKKNPMPESVRDRPTTAHEYIFMFAKSKKYYFDMEAVKERVTGNAHARGDGINPKAVAPGLGIKQNTDFSSAIKGLVQLRNIRTVWTVQTQPFPEAHFAVFPGELIEPPIKTGCPEWVCKKCGAPKRQVMIKRKNPDAFNIRVRDVKEGRIKHTDRIASEQEIQNYNEKEYAAEEREIVVAEGCDCGEGFEPGIVLDPFMGAGTTALVARQLSRQFIGFDLKAEYVKMAWKRVEPHMNQRKITEEYGEG